MPLILPLMALARPVPLISPVHPAEWPDLPLKQASNTVTTNKLTDPFKKIGIYATKWPKSLFARPALIAKAGPAFVLRHHNVSGSQGLVLCLYMCFGKGSLLLKWHSHWSWRQVCSVVVYWLSQIIARYCNCWSTSVATWGLFRCLWSPGACKELLHCGCSRGSLKVARSGRVWDVSLEHSLAPLLQGKWTELQWRWRAGLTALRVGCITLLELFMTMQ